MISFRTSTTLPLFGLLVALAGCSGETGAASSATTVQTATPVTADQSALDRGSPNHFHGHGHGGPDAIVFASLHESINLTPAQRTTIEALVKDRAPKGAPPAADRSRMTALAAGVRAGKVDPATLPTPVKNMDAFNAHIAASAKAVDTLHATLSKEQRVALVDAMTKRAADHERRGEDGAKGPGHDHHDGDALGHMGGLLGGLNLTKAQEDEIRAKLEAAHPKPSDADRAAMKQRFELVRSEMLARLQTFANDTFDARAFVAPPSSMPKPEEHADPMATRIAIITSVLDAGQRETLATRLEQGPPAFRPGAAPPPPDAEE